jgi:hypothetical protein
VKELKKGQEEDWNVWKRDWWSVRKKKPFLENEVNIMNFFKILVKNHELKMTKLQRSKY